MKKRACGILLHITSLPSKCGIGDMGPAAYRFAGFLARSKQSYWQILPLTPPAETSNLSPYNCYSAFAGNTNLLSPQLLYRSGCLKKEEVKALQGAIGQEKNIQKVLTAREQILKNVKKSKKMQKDFEAFRAENNHWLNDYSLFLALKQLFGTPDWSKWPKNLKNRSVPDKKKKKKELVGFIEHEKLLQFLFFQQWFELKKYCNQRGISIIGDMPIYVSYKSADVWANQDIFKLDESGNPKFIAGVPPDAFSDTGQLWGNPIYNWQTIKNNGYKWWLDRMKMNLKLYDVLRIDHFRGLVKFWQLPAAEKTAVNGKWVKGPGEEFFQVLYKYIPGAQIIAEDLGYITADVRQLVSKMKLPGMKVLLFAFDDTTGKNLYLPHNHSENYVVYTGTHDNNTVKGWFEKEASEKQKKALFAYLGRKISRQDLPWELIRMAMRSVAKTAIIPMQDLLCLGGQARMNRPAKEKGNWLWRMEDTHMSKQLAENMAKITQLYGRSPGE